MVVFTPSAGTAAKPIRPEGAPPEVEVLEELLDDEDELLELELDELELLLELLEEEEFELEEVAEELLLDEDELFDEELLLDEEPEPAPSGIEHSLTPPATRVPAPKVASLQMKPPLRILNVNRSARPKATLVLEATLQVLFSVQMVT